MEMWLKEQSFNGSIYYVGEDFQPMMAMLAEGVLDAEKLVTSIVSVSRVIQEVFEELVNGPAGHIEILTRPDLRKWYNSR